MARQPRQPLDSLRPTQRAATFLVHANGDDMRQLADLLATGQLRSHLSQTLPFDQLPEALRQLASGSTVGKIAVAV